MTFQEWQTTRSDKHTLTFDEAGAYAECEGYAYEGGFIIETPVNGDGGYIVPMPQEEREFRTFAEAEAFLWAEWCDGEINGGE